MILTRRDFDILRFIARYETVTRAMITQELFPNDNDGRVTRKRLGLMRPLDLVNVTKTSWSNPEMLDGMGSPVYYPGVSLPAYLAQECEDDSYLLLNTAPPHFLYGFHLLAVAKTHLMLDKAVALTPGVAVVQWYGERALRDKSVKEAAAGRFVLHVQINDKLVCKPDATFLLKKDAHSKIFMIEQDRDTTKSADRVANYKAGGYAALVENKLHLTRYFPCATVERPLVLVITTSEKRRKALQTAFGKQPSCWLYRFAALPDLKPETFLTGKVWYPCVGDAVSLVKSGVS